MVNVQIARLNTLPLCKDAPAGTAIGENQSPPCPGLADLDDGLPHAAVRDMTAGGVLGFPREPEDLAAWCLDGELGWLGRCASALRWSELGGVAGGGSGGGRDHTHGTGGSGKGERGRASGRGTGADGRRMLADSKDKGVVDGQHLALRLGDVEVVSLRMRRGMAGEKVIWRIHTIVEDGKSERQRVRVVPNTVHEAAQAGVDFENTVPFVGREESFHRVALLARDPFGLREGALGDDIARLKEIAICIASVGVNVDFCVALDVGGDDELDLHQLEAVDAEKTGIVVVQMDPRFEIGRAGTRKSKQDFR